MTREEYIDFANALKNNYTIDFDKLPEFCDMAISALSENKGDLISRQAVMDAIADTIVNGESLGYGLAEEIVSEILSVENKGEWIPVSERLPENDGQYLVTYDREDEIKVNISYFDRHGFWIGNVITWMPLPEPYKAESEE